MCKVKNIVMLALAATMLTSEVTFAAPELKEPGYVAPRTAPAARVNAVCEAIMGDDGVRALVDARRDTPRSVIVDTVFSAVPMQGRLTALLSRLRYDQARVETFSATIAQQTTEIEAADASVAALTEKRGEAQKSLEACAESDVNARRVLNEKIGGYTYRIDQLAAQGRQLTGMLGASNAELAETQRHLQGLVTTFPTEALSAVGGVAKAVAQVARGILGNNLNDETQNTIVVPAVAAVAARAASYGQLRVREIQDQVTHYVREAHVDYLAALDQTLGDAPNQAVAQVRAKVQAERLASLTQDLTPVVRNALIENGLEGRFVSLVSRAGGVSQNKQRDTIAEGVRTLVSSFAKEYQLQADQSQRAVDGLRARLDSVVRALEAANLGDLARSAAETFERTYVVAPQGEDYGDMFIDLGLPAPVAVAPAAPAAPAAAASAPAPAARPAGRDAMPVFGRR